MRVHEETKAEERRAGSPLPASADVIHRASQRPRPVPAVPRVHVSHQDGYRFVLSFGAEEVPAIVSDEPSPLGGGAGPTPVLLLAAAVGNCLASSLRFCMNKAKLPLLDLSAEVATTLARDSQGRLRVDALDVHMTPIVTPEVERQMGRCLELFESYCIVTESVRKGVHVTVSVTPRIAALSLVP